jgi:hypothetical protein
MLFAVHEQNAQYIDYVLDFFERTTTPEEKFLNGTKLGEWHEWVLPSPEFEMSMSDSDRKKADEKMKKRKPWNWWDDAADNSTKVVDASTGSNDHKSTEASNAEESDSHQPLQGLAEDPAAPKKKAGGSHHHQLHKGAREMKEHTPRHHHHHSTKSFLSIPKKHKLRIRRSSSDPENGAAP